jgi:uncharacterized protein
MAEPAYVAFPLAVAPDGHTETVALDRHIRNLVEELLFTTPGERVNRPTLGCGLAELVFDSLTDELVAVTQFVVQARLQEWLGQFIQVAAVRVSSSGGELAVTVTYRVLATDREHTEVFRR